MSTEGIRPAPDFTVRRATPDDATLVTSMVRALVAELSGLPGRRLPADAESVAGVLAGDSADGFVLLAVDQAREPVGVLTASCPLAIRAGGRYVHIEELYVLPRMRSRAVGMALLARLAEEARTVGARLVEVGLPGARYPDEPQTRAFYEAHGFETVGVRMRLALPPSGQVK